MKEWSEAFNEWFGRQLKCKGKCKYKCKWVLSLCSHNRWKQESGSVEVLRKSYRLNSPSELRMDSWQREGFGTSVKLLYISLQQRKFNEFDTIFLKRFCGSPHEIISEVDFANSAELLRNSFVTNHWQRQNDKNFGRTPDHFLLVRKNWIGGGQDFFLLLQGNCYRQDFVRSSAELLLTNMLPEGHKKGLFGISWRKYFLGLKRPLVASTSHESPYAVPCIFSQKVPWKSHVKSGAFLNKPKDRVGVPKGNVTINCCTPVGRT